MEKDFSLEQFANIVGKTFYTVNPQTMRITSGTVTSVSIYIADHYLHCNVMSDDKQCVDIEHCFDSKEALMEHLNGEDMQ